ncbi:relaxase/mobilization nuclease domain-containing protein [Campylobacter geochelonis]|uniref:relaxase/mobilization nuclease domain-containing protein n=1 Tax=Campylobacter geochelonis TaxID=1780362 RepID=UPI0007708BC9|nr:hypothetical protein [Campylobacter geochelonis]CZE50665.1 mobilization protein [Campylobacter geochelonis]
MNEKRKSCLSIQRAKLIAFWHNSREGMKSKSVYEEFSNKNELENDAFDSQQLLNLIKQKAIDDYTKNFKQTPQWREENILWEAVINCDSDSTFEQVKKAAELVCQKMGYQLIQVAIHRDEGHLENGEFIPNHHAHFVMCSLDAITGKNNARKNYGNRRLMRDLQTEVAEILGMERGEVGSKKKRMSHQEYKQHIQALESEKQPLLDKISKLENALNRAQNTPSIDIDTQLVIEELKIENKTLSKKLAKAQIKALREQLKAQNAELRGILKENKAGRADYGGLENKINVIKFEIDKLESKLKSQNFIDENSINELSQKIENLHLPSNFKVKQPDKISKILGLDI